MMPPPGRPTPASDLGEFTRLPGIFHRTELAQILTSDADFHIEAAGLALPSTELFTVYRQSLDEQQVAPPGHPAIAPGEPGHRPRPARAHPSSSDTPGSAVTRDPAARVSAQSLGELKARHHEEHLCLRCRHHVVCGIAKAADPHLLVTISRCLAFVSSDADEPAVVELQPIEPCSHPDDFAADAAVRGCSSKG
jgi:hypothetical protein